MTDDDLTVNVGVRLVGWKLWAAVALLSAFAIHAAWEALTGHQRCLSDCSRVRTITADECTFVCKWRSR